jgi:hypothetical protein
MFRPPEKFLGRIGPEGRGRWREASTGGVPRTCSRPGPPRIATAADFLEPLQKRPLTQRALASGPNQGLRGDCAVRLRHGRSSAVETPTRASAHMKRGRVNHQRCRRSAGWAAHQQSIDLPHAPTVVRLEDAGAHQESVARLCPGVSEPHCDLRAPMPAPPRRARHCKGPGGHRNVATTGHVARTQQDD